MFKEKTLSRVVRVMFAGAVGVGLSGQALAQDTGAGSHQADGPRRSDRLLDQARRRRRRAAGADGHRRGHQAQRRHQHRRTADHADRQRHGRRQQRGRRCGPVDLWPVQRQPARPGLEQDPGAGQRPPPRQLRHRRHRCRRQLDPAGLDRPRRSAEGRRIGRVRLRRHRRRHQLHHPPELPGRGSRTATPAPAVTAAARPTRPASWPAGAISTKTATTSRCRPTSARTTPSSATSATMRAPAGTTTACATPAPPRAATSAPSTRSRPRTRWAWSRTR